jgi:hypothetical protein
MAAPLTSDAFLGLVRQSGLIEPDRLDAYLEQRFHVGQLLPSEPKELATVLIRDGLLTDFQAHELVQGKFRGFTFSNKYKVLERLGCGRNSNVFLCEHLGMRRKVVLKILPRAKAENPVALARFSREARAAGALHHPNIVQTYDHGQETDAAAVYFDDQNQYQRERSRADRLCQRDCKAPSGPTKGSKATRYPLH